MHDRSVPIKGPAAEITTPASRLEEWFRITPLLLLPVALWLWLCWDWPARLGFYADDWMVLLHPFVGSADAFHDILDLVATRPVSAPFIWLAQAIVDWSPARSQLLNAAMLLASAASVGMLAAALSRVVRGLRSGAVAGASVAAATFILFPSTVGTFAWGTGPTTVIPALPLFCLAMCLLLHSEGSSWRLGLGLILSLLSHLSYEAYYFQEIPLLLIANALRGGTIKNIPWRMLVSVAIVNVACIALNRVTHGGVQKIFHSDFVRIFLGGYSHILGTLGHATREHRFLIAGTVLVAGPAGAICLARFVGAWRVHLALLLMICGVIAAGFLYASAGYGLVAEGPLARTSIVVATYYSISAGVLAAAVWCAASRNRLPGIVFCLSAVAGLIALELTARARVAEWADTWSYELARLARLPTAITSGDSSADGNRRIYVAVEDGPQLVIAPATAPWEIIGAVAWASYKATNSRLLMVDRWKGSNTKPQWMATSRNWFNRWNGHSFEQGFCSDVALFSVSGSELWSWNTSTGALNKIDPPWEYGCQ